MPQRQKLLLIGLAAAVLLWQGGVWGNSLVLQPLRELRGQVNAKEDAVSGKRAQAVAIEQAKTKLRNWQARSLPPDPGKKTRPDAVDAQRQYTAWLTELVHSGSFDEVSVTPQRRSVARNNVYVEVVVQIDGEGRFSQLAELLERFYRANLLHRIGRIQIASEDVFGDPPVKFSLEAQALALSDVPARRTIFPQTSLKEDAPAEAKQLRVATANGFPKKTPFRIRLERELLAVTNVAGDAWTVDRGVERTQPSEHAAKSMVELIPTDPATKELSVEDFREYVRTNPFVKPTPPVNYEPTFGPFSPPVVVRGKAWQYSIAAKDYDPARGEPKYQLKGDLPAGLTLNETTGQLTWKPDAEQPAGVFNLDVAAVHPSAPEGRLQEELTLKLVEPNTAPKFVAVGTSTVYRGQPWKITVEAKDPDVPAQKMTYKLGDALPGMQINAETGEVAWTPGDDQPVGPVSFTVTATDSGTPPQTATTSVSAKVAEDTAKQTFLFGIVRVDDEPQALFSDKSQNNRKLTLRVGDELRAADIEATIEDISDLAITVQRGESRYRMKLGDTIRSLDTATPVTPAGSAETPN